VNEKDWVRRDTPHNKVNVGARMKFEGSWSCNLSASWVDKTERLITDLAGNEYLARVDSYTVVSGRIGYNLWKGRGEASLAVSNLFNEKHYEYPPGINLPDRSSDQIGRSILGKVSYRF
jgi:outer membrane receptor protein involved in Fe transport